MRYMLYNVFIDLEINIMNSAVQNIAFLDQFSKNAVNFIDSFGINWHGIDNLGEATNFLHSFKGITERFQKLTIDDLLNEIDLVECIDHPDADSGFTTDNRDLVVKFLQEVKVFKEEFLNLNNGPDFISKLEQLKKQSRELNYLEVRAIIYHNFLA